MLDVINITGISAQMTLCYYSVAKSQFPGGKFPIFSFGSGISQTSKTSEEGATSGKSVIYYGAFKRAQQSMPGKTSVSCFESSLRRYGRRTHHKLH